MVSVHFSVHKQINKFLNTKYLPTVDLSSNNAFKYIVLPYFGPQSDKLKLEVSEILKKHFTGVDFKVILYFSGVRGVERYEHASLAASLKKKSYLMLEKQLSYCL